jgi:protein-S-isoprenylcysteine O-methyltransferase Ste14
MWLQIAAWLACLVYSTIPSFWLMIHPFAERWRSGRRSPYLILLPAWMAMWAITAVATRPWRHVSFYTTGWAWVPAALLFAAGFYLYAKAGKSFGARQLVGLPEVLGNAAGGQHEHEHKQRLATNGIRARVRHPVYLAHLCEMLAWSAGTGLAVCWALTAFAIATGAVMIRMEDAELQERFGDEYRAYRRRVPALLPRMFPGRQL